MNSNKHPLYIKDLENISSSFKNWDLFRGKSVLISGVSGMIGSFLVDLLMYQNRIKKLDTKIIGIGRNKERAQKRFSEYWNSDLFEFISHDINSSIFPYENKVDFLLHLASNTDPITYATDPIGTILTNIVGTNNLLNWASQKNVSKIIFASSVEIYGENRGDVDYFNESYLGKIDSNTLRAGYPEAKRAAEALCQAYIKQYELDIVIARLSRIYGPTMLLSDSKAHAQFIKNGLNSENIVLKSEGNQLYSYTHVADAVNALLLLLDKGGKGEAYNIANKDSDTTLRNLATHIANVSNTKVIFELPSETEKAGFSKATKALLDSSKIEKLGFAPIYSIYDGIKSTLKILKEEGFFS